LFNHLQDKKYPLFSNIFLPSRRVVCMEKKEGTDRSSTRHSNYISFTKRHATSPMPSSRSNLSYDDTPRARNINADFLLAQANNAAHISAPNLESYKASQVVQYNDSALQHWLADTERATQAASPRLGQTTQGGRPGVPPPEHAPGSNAVGRENALA
jgi:hypothetical protein